MRPHRSRLRPGSGSQPRRIAELPVPDSCGDSIPKGRDEPDGESSEDEIREPGRETHAEPGFPGRDLRNLDQGVITERGKQTHKQASVWIASFARQRDRHTYTREDQGRERQGASPMDSSS